MRMHWPPDGSSADLELTGAGPHHMPYDQLWAVDDQGTRYAVRLEGDRGGTVTWFGIARLSSVPRAMPGGLIWSATGPTSSGSLSGRRQRPAAGPRRWWPNP